MTSYTSVKRVSDTARVYSGQGDALPVVEWLNQNAGLPAARRVATLIADLRTLCGSICPMVLQFPPTDETARFERKHPRLFRSISLPEAVKRGLVSNPATWPTIMEGHYYDAEAQKRAQAVLARYSFRPHIFGSPFGSQERGFRVEMLPSRLFTSGQRITIADAKGEGREQESWNVLRVIRLTQDGLIDKIRQCSCRKWFFAQHCKRQWCSTRCRHRVYKKTQEWREKRNRYMRNYYREHYPAQSRKSRKGGK